MEMNTTKKQRKLTTLFSPPKNEAEKKLAVIWSDLLNIEPVGVDDNFFELGGDSLLAIRVLAKSQTQGLYLTPKMLFANATVSGLAKAILTESNPLKNEGVLEGKVPLLPYQSWLLQTVSKEVNHHVDFSGSLTLTTRPKAEILEKALKAVIYHHDVLRAKFVKRNGEWEQIITGIEDTAPFEYCDCSRLNDDQIKEKKYQFCSGLDVENGPVLRLIWLDHGVDHDGELLFVFHSLVVDLISRNTILVDFRAAYEQLQSNHELILPPKTISVKTWADCLTVHSQTESLVHEIHYWEQQFEQPFTQLKTDFEGENTRDSQNTHTVILDLSISNSLLNKVVIYPAAFNTDVNDILLTAFAKALSLYNGSDYVQVDMQSHGREDWILGSDVSRTVGALVVRYPCIVNLSGIDDTLVLLDKVESKLEKIPNRGIGFFLLKYLHPDVNVRNQFSNYQLSDTFLHFHGDYGRKKNLKLMPSWSGVKRIPADLYCSRAHRMPYKIELNARLRKNGLNLDFQYSSNIYSEKSIQAIANNLVENLIELNQHL